MATDLEHLVNLVYLSIDAKVALKASKGMKKVQANSNIMY